MASKWKTKVESEIEKFRAIQQWDKALDVARTQLTKTADDVSVLTNLLQGEKDLELYLRDNSTSEGNVEMAKIELVNAEKCLRDVIQRAPKERESLRQEAVLLLGKLYFAQAKFPQVLHEFDSINLDRLTLHSVSNRMLKILAEGLAVKAMCMEKMLDKDLSSKEVNTEQIIKYYERAGDILLLFLQNRDIAYGVSSPVVTGGQMTVGNGCSGLQDDSLGSILETAIQKSPLIFIENGQISLGVGRFRQLLRAVGSTNSKNLYRMMLARQLAEVLLRGICSSTYPKLNLATESKSPKDVFRAKQYDTGPNVFLPDTEEEEAILLLLIAEGMANKEALLDRKPENAQRRRHAFDNSTAVHDLLTIALVRRSNCTILAEVLERSLKFSYEEIHVWYQFALSLIETGKYDRAYMVLKECHRLKPTDATILLLQAKLCFEKLQQVENGINASQKACDVCDNDVMKSRAIVMQGIGYSHQLVHCRVKNTREQLLKLTLESFTQAHDLDACNAEASFHLALHLAEQRKLSDALKYTRHTLNLQPDNMNALTLLSLIFSAEKKYEKALEVIKIALGDYPDVYSLLLVKSRLESCLGLFKQSVSSCAQMLRVWKKEYDSVQDLEKRGTGLLEKFTASENKAFLLVADVAHDAGSIRESQAASRVEKALSEVVSSAPSSIWVRHGPQHSWSLQSQIWLHLAEVYLDNGYQHEATACVNEALSMYPLSHLASYAKGRVLENQENYTEAKCHFESALSINPYHVKSMIYLGRCFHMLGNTQLAEKTLRDAVNTDPTSHNAWRELGIVLKTSSEFDTAAECLLTAIHLESSTPIIPFGILQQA